MNVLIVDDEPPARDRLARLIEEMDEIDVAGMAGNGKQAVEFCSDTQPDVVLMDIRMPGMVGER